LRLRPAGATGAKPAFSRAFHHTRVRKACSFTPKNRRQARCATVRFKSSPRLASFALSHSIACSSFDRILALASDAGAGGASAGEVAIRGADRDLTICGEDEPPRRREPERRLALEHVGHHGARRVARYARDLGQVAKYGRKRHPAPWFWLIYCGRHRTTPLGRAPLSGGAPFSVADVLSTCCPVLQPCARQCCAPSCYNRRSGSTVALACGSAVQ